MDIYWHPYLRAWLTSLENTNCISFIVELKYLMFTVTLNEVVNYNYDEIIGMWMRYNACGKICWRDMWVICHICVDSININIGHPFANEAKVRGTKSVILKVKGQNYKFMKIRRPKMQFNQNILHKNFMCWNLGCQIMVFLYIFFLYFHNLILQIMCHLKMKIKCFFYNLENLSIGE
jgi:hypothetical protein